MQGLTWCPASPRAEGDKAISAFSEHLSTACFKSRNSIIDCFLEWAMLSYTTWEVQSLCERTVLMLGLGCVCVLEGQCSSSSFEDRRCKKRVSVDEVRRWASAACHKNCREEEEVGGVLLSTWVGWGVAFQTRQICSNDEWGGIPPGRGGSFLQAKLSEFSPWKTPIKSLHKATGLGLVRSSAEKDEGCLGSHPTALGPQAEKTRPSASTVFWPVLQPHALTLLAEELFV